MYSLRPSFLTVLAQFLDPPAPVWSPGHHPVLPLPHGTVLRLLPVRQQVHLVPALGIRHLAHVEPGQHVRRDCTEDPRRERGD